YQGGPTCPSTAINVSNWGWYSVSGWGSPPGPFSSSTALLQAIANLYVSGPNNTHCSMQYTPPPTYQRTVGSQYGIPTNEYYTIPMTLIWATTLNPPCAYSQTETQTLSERRSVSCPTGYSVVYSAGPPQIGPYCVQSAVAVPSKQIGCPTCDGESGLNAGAANAGSGAVRKGDPVDASNGNLYEAETDYAGGGSDPLRFVRTYNSLGAACLPTAGAGEFLGGG